MRQSDREDYNKYMREYYSQHKGEPQYKERRKKYYKQNIGEIKRRAIEWYQSHREKCIKGMRGYYQKHKEKILKESLEKRHKLGLNKRRNFLTGLSHTKEYKKLYAKRYKYNFRNAGELTIKTIQLIYEDNIKKYGTLTCEYCKKPIEIGKDNLEHKTPLSRSGTNNYENLCVACERCNYKKNNKTVEEFMEYLKKKE